MFDARFLVVGQGLAGTVLVDALLERGQSVHIADQHMVGAASKAAAGLWNPLTARTLQESWRFSTFMPLALQYYQKKCAERKIDPPRPLPLLKALPNQHSLDHWNRTADTAGSSCEKSNGPPPPEYADQLHIGPYCGWVKGAGQLNVAAFIEAARHDFIELGILQETLFQSKSVEWMPQSGVMPQGGLKWNNNTYEYLLMARGHQERFDPIFGWLPFNPAQGELLEATSTDLQIPFIVHASGFLLPLGAHRYLLGSTYEWDELSPTPTEKGLRELMRIKEGITPMKLQIDAQLSGIRPTVADRRPLIGAHPAQQNLYIFNGLGTKGVSMAPAMAQMLVDHLLKGCNLLPEIDIQRFLGRYRRSNHQA